MTERRYGGLLCIGDPHLASRVPGFRRDDYPETILGKVQWSIEYATDQRLLPVLLGDLFHWPRDNANRLLVRLVEMLSGQLVLGVAGNHDCSQDRLCDDDSLMVLARADRIRLLSEAHLWTGTMNGRPVVIGGTPWGQRIPERYEPSLDDDRRPVVFWITHHNVILPGYEDIGYLAPREIPGIDAVINGHFHRSLEPLRKGATLWLNPGGITRVTRGDASRERDPGVLRIDVTEDDWAATTVEVPHQPFDEVFYPELADDGLATGESRFVKGLADLVNQRTDTAAGLWQFLDENLSQFPAPVAQEVRALAQEVSDDEAQNITE